MRLKGDRRTDDVRGAIIRYVRWLRELVSGRTKQTGKTALCNAVLWAMTGKRVREQDGLIDELGAARRLTMRRARK